MTEIVYRGKQKDTGEWVEGFHFQFGPKGKEKDYIMPFWISDFYGIPVASGTIGRYLGRTDNNGKKVYEHDLVLLSTGTGERITAVCKFGTVRIPILFELVEITGFYFELPDGRKIFPRANAEVFEVIGNIHDNPELITERSTQTAHIKKTKSKAEFIQQLSDLLINAELDVKSAQLIDDQNVMIHFAGGDKRVVNIDRSSRAAIILDVVKQSM